MTKNAQATAQLHSSYMLASNSQNSPSQASTVNFQIFKLDLEKAEELETKLPTSTGSSKKQEIQKKILMIGITTMVWPLTMKQTFWIVKSSGP